MKKILYKITINFVFVISFLNVSAQNNFTTARYTSPIQQSPDISNLGRFGEIPIGQYSGQPNINIPLYTIKVRDFELPISIAYQGGGIRVAEEASSVGLGWSFFCGGAIVQIVNGRNDLSYGGYIGRTIPNPGFPGNNFGTFFDSYNTSSCQTQVSHTNINTQKDAYLFYDCDLQVTNESFDMDTEPDFWLYNFGNYTGKFFWHKSSNSFQSISRDKINIEFLGIDLGWKIKTPDGNVYQFLDKEEYVSCSYGYGNGTVSGVSNLQSTTFYLSEIKLPTKETIFFSYIIGDQICQLSNQSEAYGYQDDSEPSNTSFYGPNGESYSYPIDQFGFKHSASQTYFHPLYLDHIIFPSGSLVFNWQSRLDIHNGKRLTRIDVQNTNYHPIKNIVFDNGSYFQGQTSTGFDFVYSDCLLMCSTNGVNTENILYKRLKLKSVSLSEQEKPYIFSYDESVNLPSKQSYAQDYWGYFNGQISVTTLLSKPYFEALPSYVPNNVSQTFSDRTANDFSKAWILNRIDYPTGGYTLMEFEPNTFSNYSYPIQIGMESRYCKGGGVRIKSIKDFDPNAKCNERTYKYEFQTVAEGINVTKSFGKIMDLPKIFRKFHLYAVSDCFQGFSYCVADGFNLARFYGESMRSLSPTFQSNYVGYDKVVEILGNEENNNGKIEYNYINEVPECNQASIAPCSYTFYNGKPNLIIYYNSEGKIVKKEDFTYSPQTDWLESYGIKFETSCFGVAAIVNNLHSYAIQANRVNLESNTETLYDTEGQTIASKKTIYNYHPNHLLFKETIQNSDNSKYHTYFSFPEQYYYNANSQIKNLIDNNILDVPIEKVKVKEGSNGIFEVLSGEIIAYNIDNTGLKKSISFLKNSTPIPLNQFKFSWVNMYGELPLSTTTGPYSQSGQYEYPPSYLFEYSDNQLSLVTNKSENNLAYIWGYNNTYPIAETKNATSSECGYTGFENPGYNGWYSSSSVQITTSDLIKTGSTSVFLYNEAGVSKTFEVRNNASNHSGYKASVWVKKGINQSFIEIGILGQTPIRVYNTIEGDEWNLIEVELPRAKLNGYINDDLIIKVKIGCMSSIGAYFDDLRFHPMDAHMTSYTYEPFIGVTSISDINNKPTYYKYDGFNRLLYVQDFLGNILKKYEYHYKD
jgi:hypothetical protein